MKGASSYFFKSIEGSLPSPFCLISLMQRSKRKPYGSALGLVLRYMQRNIWGSHLFFASNSYILSRTVESDNGQIVVKCTICEDGRLTRTTLRWSHGRNKKLMVISTKRSSDPRCQFN